jgi:hypothetical protein
MLTMSPRAVSRVSRIHEFVAPALREVRLFGFDPYPAGRGPASARQCLLLAESLGPGGVGGGTPLRCFGGGGFGTGRACSA